MPPTHTHPTRQYLLWLSLIFIVIIVYAVFRIIFPAASQPMSTEATMQTSVIPNLPPPTPSDYISAQEEFDYLVSYTDTGFSPPALGIGLGDAVRFTNNSSGVLNLSIAEGVPRSVARGSYVQYTADVAGGISYSDGTISGALMVAQ